MALKKKNAPTRVKGASGGYLKLQEKERERKSKG